MHPYNLLTRAGAGGWIGQVVFGLRAAAPAPALLPGWWMDGAAACSATFCTWADWELLLPLRMVSLCNGVGTRCRQQLSSWCVNTGEVQGVLGLCFWDLGLCSSDLLLQSVLGPAHLPLCSPGIAQPGCSHSWRYTHPCIPAMLLLLFAWISSKTCFTDWDGGTWCEGEGVPPSTCTGSFEM